VHEFHLGSALAADGEDGVLERRGYVFVGLGGQDVRECGHVRFLSEPLADLTRVCNGEAALSLHRHAALGPLLSLRCANARDTPQWLSRP
jgi:hypothetical protein